VRLTWTASATAVNYTLEAGQTSGAADLANISLGNVTALAASAPPGVYYVRTRAQNACGTSAPSNEVVVTLGAPVQVPQPPTSLTATVAGRNVTVQWTPPTSGGLPSRYQLEAGYGPGLANAAVIQTVVPILGAANVPPATYYIRVRSLNSAGLSDPTADVAVTVP
jgi:predicted phage tail protein